MSAGAPATLRTRLFASLALAVGVSIALTIGIAALLIRGRAEDQALTALGRQADALAAATRSGSGTEVFRSSGGRPRRVRARSPLVAQIELRVPSGDRSGRLAAEQRDLLFASRALPGGRVVIVRPGRIAATDWEPYLTSVLLAGLGGAVVAALLSLFLARRIASPLRDLVLASGRLAQGEAGVQVPTAGPRELAELAHSFNSTSSELAQARASQHAFLMSVSHELKTPLTAVRGYAEALADGAVAPQEAARTIASEARRLERLVGDLLDLARLDRRSFAVQRGDLELREVAESACNAFRARATGLGIELELAGEARARACGDRDRLVQVVSNLVENALRVTPAGGRVVVTIGELELSVRDSGPGLTDEDLPRAFERFYLHERYRSERSVGSGLGLAIVRELVEAMGGEVRAGRAPGGGAEFRVRLTPVRTSDQGVTPRPAGA